MSECILHGGVGYARRKGGSLHRQALERKLGRKLLPGEVARHTCDCKECINEDHLIVGSQGDNIRDAYERKRQPVGSARANAVLDETTVVAIRDEYIPRHREHGTRAIARRLGVSQWTVSHALRNLTWKGA